MIVPLDEVPVGTMLRPYYSPSKLAQFRLVARRPDGTAIVEDVRTGERAPCLTTYWQLVEVEDVADDT